ncbi:unnamed protein product [Paramecium octaurelia]|uniref:Fibrocystin-L n=1 Tax=Paramecium octaurelia TaxID=43137 RepID=A0A8S1UG54_PAROT|nr:unnamed protein product [Paramecium octaurelia]
MLLRILITVQVLLMPTLVQAMLDASKDSTKDAVVILAVSTILGKENSVPVGSLMGGTTLYMKVQGLDQTASNNAVYIGKYPCIISDKGVNGLFVNCKTTKSNPNDHNLSNLQITVKVQDKPDSVCTFSYTYCHFSYSTENTPKLYYVTPRSNYPRMMSYWRAKWVVSSNAVEYLEGQFMGANRCDRFSIQDLYPKEINYQDDKVVCQVSAEIQAGYYDYTIKSQSGYQTNSIGIKQKKVYSDRVYNSKVVPIITGLNTNLASPEGQILEIFGYGFSPQADENRVKISGRSETIEVLASTPTSIKAKIPKQQSLLQDKTQNSLYIQGSGLHYTRWDVSGLNLNCGSFRQQIISNKASLDGRIKFDGIYPEPDVQSTFGEYYGQYFRGFLKAPFTGVYRFYLSSDNCAQFYIQKTETQQPIRPDNPIAASNWNPYRNYWFETLSYPSAIKSISEPVTLEQDNLYYIEIYHINEISEGHLTLSMEIESETRKPNSLNSIYQLSTSYTPIKEVIEFVLYNSNGNTLLKGNYRLRFTYGTQKTPQTDTFYIYTSSDLTASSSAYAMKIAISNSGAPYYITVTSTKLDNTGNPLDDTATSFAGYKYTITFDSHRGQPKYRALPKIVQSTLSGGVIASTVECIQEPADPISGSFQLSMTINGQETLFEASENNYDLNFDVSTITIANNIQKLTGQASFVWTVGQPQDGQKWFIVFRSYFEGLDDLKVTNNMLVSGNGDVSITLTKVQPDSNNMLFEPIPNELLFTYSQHPQIQVEVQYHLLDESNVNVVESELILAGCQQQSICDLTLSDEKTPILKSYSVAGSLLSLTLQEGVDLKITTINIDIQFAGADCTNIQITNVANPHTITCNLEQLNGQNIKEAGGMQIPIIHHKDIGFSKIDQSIIGENVNLEIISIQPNAASSDGGTTLTITGAGFPKNLNRNFIFQIDGQNVKPLQISNTQLVFIAPKQISGGTGSIELQFNSKTATNVFTYDESLRIQVTGLEFNSKSPAFKGEMTITGTNFGTILEDIKVTLIGNKSYNAKVLSITDTQIKVYLRGGMPGDYKVTVTRKNFGDSYANNDDNLFKYIIPINSVTLEDGISQAKGSEAGGTVIKITGSHFVKGETLVFIGQAVNWLCEIDETKFTSENIYCTVPAKYEFYNQEPQLVVVTLLVTLESTCLDNINNCLFTYDNQLTPKLDAYPESVTQYIGSRILTEEDHSKPDYYKLIQRKRFLWTEESKKHGHNHILNVGKSARRDMLTSADLVLTQQKTYKPDDVETLSGIGLTSSVSVVFKGPVTQTVTATVNDNTFTYTIPNLPQGYYSTYILTQTGYADKIWVSIIELSITSIENAAIGGQILTINGAGFNANYNPIVKVGSTTCTELQVISSAQIKCRMARQSGTSAVVTLTQSPSESNSATPYTVQYTFGIKPTSSSPLITSISGVTYDVNKQANIMQTANAVLIFTGSMLSGSNVAVTLEFMNNKINGVVSEQSDTSVTSTFADIPVGVYYINIQINDNYAYFNDITQQKLIVQANILISNNPTISYAGGAIITFTGKGFDQNTHFSSVSLCGFNCPITQASYTSLSCEAPKLLTTSVFHQYSSLQEPPRYIKPSEVLLLTDSGQSVSSFFDHQQSTFYSSTATSNCFIKVDFGKNRLLKLHQLRYLPRIDIQAIILRGAVFQYTTDGTLWQTLLVVDQTVHTGWNIYVPAEDISNIKAIRLFDQKGAAGSSCQLAEIELKGWVFSNSNNDYTIPTLCDADITINGQAIDTISGAGIYSASSVPIVNTVDPLSGRFTEEAVITISGSGFENGQTTVSIDGVTCSIQSVTQIQIICKTGIKDLDQTQLNGDFQVRVNGNLAINNQQFIYATKWSDINTWGGHEFPGDGDSVIVNAGQTLIVDVQTPKLMQVLVEGTLTFSDDLDTSMDAHYIVIREGKFNIGTDSIAHQHKVQITLHGLEGDIQMPAMGNKVLGCHQCQLTIHGKERTPTWTLLSTTVKAGATQITVDDVVDWQIGEQIIITSSEVQHLQSEKRYITAVSEDKKTLHLDSPLQYKHYSEIETYGDEQFPMKVEVGLLTRNIVIQGEESKDKYGAEKGTVGKIQYAEFRHGGQPRIIGRYPVHFHLNGEVDDSYVIGNSIHDSYARCLTIHGVHYLKVQKNVCYNTFGHAIFLEDGIETNNIIEDNLVTNTKQSWIMLQTDISVSTYWVTNPQNILRRNRSGGSEWYGFWYEIKTNPDGPSATSDICPPGLNILEFKDNWSHSNGKFGLRIFHMAPRLFPCRDVATWSNSQPYVDNPSLQAVFETFRTWKNDECGILAEELGNIYFKDIMIADSRYAGFQSHKTNYSYEGAVLDNALIIGKSIYNAQPDAYYQGSRAIIVPRTNGFLAKNIRMFNFGNYSALIESCSTCWHDLMWVQGGKNTHFMNLRAYNSDQAHRIYWQKHRREIFWDIDGSFTNIDGGAYIIPYKKHIDGIPGCVTHPEDFWDNSIICAMNQVTIRDVLVNNPMPEYDFQGVDMKLYRLDSTNLAVKMDPLIDENKYIEGETMKPMKNPDGVASFVSVFATGYIYNVHFKFGASDPLSMGIFSSPYFTEVDKAVILRFNYSANRETFDIMRHIDKTFPITYNELESIPDTNQCNQGDWFNDKSNKLFFLCLSGKNKKKYEYVEVRGVICRKQCDSLGDMPQESQYRLWSNPTTWIDNKIPVDGDSPIIQAGYQVVLDVDTPKLVNLIIFGTLIFDEKRASTKLEAERIWIRSGKLLAGNATNPFPGRINIILNGEFGDNPLVIDANLDVGNKVLAVTRAMELYSTPPGTVWTRLALYADAGTTKITVQECLDWVIGDEIVFGPSGTDPDQREKRIISAISGCTITLDRALEFDHFGAPQVTVDKPGIGQLDMRSLVGHLTRKIKIEGGPSKHGLGCRVLIYQFEEPEANLGFPRRGYTILRGVEFNNCGQYDTSRSGLDFRNLNSDIIKTPSEVIGCSFHDTTGMLMTIENSQYILVKNNVFFTGIKALVQINNSQYVKFQNNALIYVKKRLIEQQSKFNWAVLGNFIYMDGTQMTRDIVDISGNVGQGSQDTGFFIMGTKCEDALKSSLYNNHCSSSVLACFAIRQAAKDCTYSQGLIAYHSEVGIMYAVQTENAQLDKSMLAENKRGLALSLGSWNFYENTIKLSNIFISALARPDCTKCYTASQNPHCNNIIGVQMGSVTLTAFPPIDTGPSSEYDIICKPQRIDLKVYMDTIDFHNFRLSYDDIPQCGLNAALRQHPGAHDMLGQHYLTNSQCINCEFDALLYKTLNPNIRTLGWFGGCGTFECPGLINFLVEDQTGHFFGKVSQAIGNNTYIGPNVTYCTRQEAWNGYWCLNRQITAMGFMSVAPDYNKRLYSPIKLTDGEFFNEVNSQMEWHWSGAEPKNLRESKFVALIPSNKIVNMSNAGMNPTASEYQLSKRYEAGSPEDFVILKWQFQVPQVIQVSVGNKVILPGMTTNSKHHNLINMTDQCGANNYFYQNNTIHFVVNGQLGCKVKITLKNTLQISTRLEITTDQFFADKFLQYAMAQLGGDPFNYFIIGIKRSTRRFLDQTISYQVSVDWSIVDNVEIGSQDSNNSWTFFEGLATQLESFNPPPEIGKVLEQSTTIKTLADQIFPSTEPTSSSPLEPEQTESTDVIQNHDNQESLNESSNNQDDTQIELDQDEPIQQQEISENDNNSTPGAIKKSIRQPETTSNTVIIVASVISSVVGVSIIVAILLYYKKIKLAKLIANRNQKVDNEFFKVNLTELQLQIQNQQQPID